MKSKLSTLVIIFFILVTTSCEILKPAEPVKTTTIDNGGPVLMISNETPSSGDIVVTSQESAVAIQKLVTEKMEKAYFEGQRDALEGDIRIEKIPATDKWRWSKSPWDNDKEPTYVPNPEL